MFHVVRNTLLVIAFCLLLAAPVIASAPVNINTASVEQLQSVKGIGSQTAEKIIAYRTDHGAFSSVDQLCNIKGIGEASLAKMSDQLCVK